MPSLIRRLLAFVRSGTLGGGPPGEGALARRLRRRRDRGLLTGLDDRLLRDMGLRREVSPAGLDIVPLSCADPGAGIRHAKPLPDRLRRDETVALPRHGRAALDRP
ncbi:hypothetical protein [Methylobacterium aquaticum]|uniref:hypothetical protein n=1 Tax=Methylobacterium aquaticum TaxID=270351 RepID=UPI001931E460|nr:hypothetical protein [Methylobacterium aquaticum]QRE74321.1 hypothetical protein F1D61_12495 [Methylobacterium aquaticum]